jgi:phosphatidylserine/phosphatidylglycerophosphate/cardiolipin synthase-like enzyme
VNTALRALHDLLCGENKEQAWRSVVKIGYRIEAERGRLDDVATSRWITASGLDVSVTQWRTCLQMLGVIDVAGCLDPTATADVGTALRLVADSFTPIPVPPNWELVATVPPTLGRSLRPVLRRTAAVLLERFEQARKRVILAAPFMDAKGVGFLSDAVVDAGRRGITIQIITTDSSADALNPLRCRWKDATGSLHLSLLRTPDSPLGSHAKVVVTDDSRAYIGSANLTSAGLSRHLELGVEVAGPQVADLARLLRSVAAQSFTHRISPGDPGTACPREETSAVVQSSKWTRPTIGDEQTTTPVDRRRGP